MKEARNLKKVGIILILSILSVLALLIAQILINDPIGILGRGSKDSGNLQEEEVITYDTEIILDSLSLEGLAQEGTKIKVSTEDSIDVKVLDALSREELVSNSSSEYTIPETKAIIQVKNIEMDKTYQIKLEETGTADGYIKQFENLVLEINANNDTITSRIKSITRKVTDENGEEKVVTIDGSADNIASLNGENSDGIVTVKGDNGVEVLYKIGENGEWQEYSENITVEQNGTVYIKTKKNGVEGSVEEKEITNIDKQKPVIQKADVREVETQTAGADTEDENDDEFSYELFVDIKARDQEGLSGIVKYGIGQSNTEEPVWEECESSLEIEATLKMETGNGEYYLWVEDLAGNQTVQEFNVSIPVIRITSSPVETLVGTEYTTIAGALTALREAGLSAESEVSTLTVIRNIVNESAIVTDDNIVLNLSGYSIIANSSDTATIDISGNSKVKLVNQKNENINYERGKIQNTLGNGVKIGLDATFTMGTDERRVSQSSPLIEGAKNGVENSEEGTGDNKKTGTFNFYDGRILSGKREDYLSIKGEVTDAAYLKNPGITRSETNNQQTAILVTISTAEAAIGKKTFVRLEQAIAYANQNINEDGSQTEIVVIKDITRSEDADDIEIDNTKNILLNFNGWSISSAVDIVNNGKLEIKDEIVNDEEIERTGRIALGTAGTIKNNGEMTLTSGMITSEKVGADLNRGVAIDSKNKFKITGGTIKIGGSYTHAVNVSGEVEMTGGEIVTTGVCGRGLSIAEDGIGPVSAENSIIKVTGGTITTSGYGGHGIFVGDTGKLEMSNATITTKGSAAKGIYNAAGGTIRITESSITTTGNESAYGIYNLGDANITNAQIKTSGGNDTHAINSTGTLNIEGTTISTTGFSSYGINSTGNLEITDGKVSTTRNYAHAINNTGTAKVTGGTLTVAGYNAFGINNSGTVDMEGVTINATGMNGYGVNNLSTGKTTVNDGSKIIGAIDGIKNDGVLNVNGGEISSLSLNSWYGIWVTGTGKITITGGKITGRAAGIACENNIKIDIEITGGEISSPGNGISYYGSGVVNINGGTVNVTTGSGSAVVNGGNNGKIVIDDGTINSTGRGVTNNAAGTIEIKGGTINSTGATGAGVYNASTGTVYLGNSEDDINDNSIIINSKFHGIRNVFGNVEFYDGQINSDIERSIIGKINKIPDDSRIEVTENEEGTIETAKLTKTFDNIVAIEDTEYTTIEEAIEKAEDGDTIRFIKNAFISKDITFPSDKNVKLDLNGYKIREFSYIYNEGTLEIIDSSKIEANEEEGIEAVEGTGIIKGTGFLLIDNSLESSVLKISGGTMYINATGTSSSYCRCIRNMGTLYLAGGLISVDGNYIVGINSTENSNTNMSDGKINTTGEYSFALSSSGNIQISGGELTTRGNNSQVINSAGMIDITGGKITATGSSSDGIYDGGNGKKINLSNVEIKAARRAVNVTNKVDVVVNEGTKIINGLGFWIAGTSTLTINDIDAQCTDDVIELDNASAELTINGGKMQSTNFHGIRLRSAKKVTINGGTIQGKNCGIYTDANAEIQINGGSIIGNSENGIYKNGGTLSLILGVKNDNVDEEMFTVKGAKWGIGSSNSNITIKFYDGTVIGAKNQSIRKPITDQEEGYELVTTVSDDGKIETSVLKKVKVAKVVSTGIEYETLKEAIDAVEEDKEETVELLRNINLGETSEVATISENHNITINFKGFTIASVKANVIENNGVLKFVDDQETARRNY